MARMTLSFIEGLQAKEKLYRLAVDGCRGLYLQVARTKAGLSKTWVFRYRVYTGGVTYGVGNRPSKEGSYTIGAYPQWSPKRAQDRADQLRDQVKAGTDPNEVVTKPVKAKRIKPVPPPPAPEDLTPTFRAVAEDFFVGHVQVKNQPSYQKYQRWALDSRVLPALGDMKITDVTAQVVTRFLDGLSSTPVTANRIRALLSKLFSWSGRRVELLEGKVNPVTGHERHEEVPSERRLTVDEISQLGDNYRRALTVNSGFTEADRQLAHAAIFLLLTGARSGVVLCQQKENQFPEDQVLCFDAKAPGLKGCRKVYMGTHAVELLPKIPFDINRGELWRLWLRLRPDECTCSLHDLRRTFLSVSADLGYDEALVDALVHKSRGKVRDTYFRRADPTLLAVAEKIGQNIAELLGLVKPVRSKTRTKVSAT